MTGDQSRLLKVGDRVRWGATMTDLGTVVGVGDLETTSERGPNDHQHKKIARSAEDVSQCYRGSVQRT